MTKMMNILEEYMARKKFLYVRVDGSTTISDRL
jgi:SNF2 family DNA or RNA helicase